MSSNRLSLAAVLLLSSAALTVQAQDGAPGLEHEARPESFAQILGALTSGKNVAVTVTFNQCTLVATGASGPEVTGGFHIGSYLAPGNQYVAFSDVHETLSPQNERLTEYVRYRLTPDGKVSVRTTTVQLSDGKLSNQAEYSCAVGKGVSFSWHRH